jgi:ubiquitin C-terminal hydrolase
MHILHAIQVLEGANCYQCDACRAKVRAHRSIQVHNVAPVVVVALKRFVFTAASLLGPSKVREYRRW